MSGSSPVQITVLTSAPAAATVASAVAALPSSQLQTLAQALVTAMSALSSSQLQTLLQAMLATLPKQATDASATPATGVIYITASGFLSQSQ